MNIIQKNTKVTFLYHNKKGKTLIQVDIYKHIKFKKMWFVYTFPKVMFLVLFLTNKYKLTYSPFHTLKTSKDKYIPFNIVTHNCSERDKVIIMS